jgi:uncharacterized protein YkwD
MVKTMDVIARGKTERPAKKNFRRRTAAVAIVVIAVAIGAACDPLGVDRRVPYPAPYGSTRTASDLLAATTWNRHIAGLPALAWDDQLGGLATSWAEHMAATGDFSHRDLNAVIRSPAYAGWRALAENILVAPCFTSAASIMIAWGQSPVHRANLLSPWYTRTGVGVACSADGRVWAVQNFGA